MSIIYLNQAKKNYAEDIYLLLLGKKTKEKMTAEHAVYLQERYTELLKEKDVDIKDHDEAVDAIYKILGGATRTQEQEKKIRDTVAKVAKGKKKEQDEGKDADDDDEESEDEEDADDDDDE